MGKSGASVPPPPSLSAEELALIKNQNLTLEDTRNLLRQGATDSAEVQNVFKDLSGFWTTKTTPGSKTEDVVSFTSDTEKIENLRRNAAGISATPGPGRAQVLDAFLSTVPPEFKAEVERRIGTTAQEQPGLFSQEAEKLLNAAKKDQSLAKQFNLGTTTTTPGTVTPDKTERVVNQAFVDELRGKLKEYEASVDKYNEDQTKLASDSLTAKIKELTQNMGISEETDKAIRDALNRAPTEFENITNENALLEAKRYNQALKGEVPLSAASQQAKLKEFQLLKESAARSGNVIEGDSPETAIGKSTSGNEALGQFKQSWGLREDAERRGDLSFGAGQSLSRTGLYSSMGGQDFGQALSARSLASSPVYPMGGAPGQMSLGYATGQMGYSPVNLLPGYGSLASGYGAAQQPYANQRQLQYGGVMQGYQNASAEQAGMYNLLGTGLGTYAGLYGLGKVPSSKTFKKDILEMEEGDEDESLSLVSKGKVYRWNYKGEPDGPRRHMSLMAEEAPDDVRAPDGKHLDVGNYLGLLTSAVKSLTRKVEALEA